MFVDLGFILKAPLPIEVKPAKQCINPTFASKARSKHLTSSDYREKQIPGAQFYDSFYQPTFPQRNQNSNINYMHSNHLRNVFESADMRNSRSNTPDCAAAVPSVFDRYPTAESISGNDEEPDEEFEFRQQQSSNYFKDYEEDLEEFLTECIQSPLPSQLATSWNGYNSPGEFSNSFKDGRDQDLGVHSRHQPYDMKTGSVFEKPTLNKHSVAPANVFVARRINLVTKDISDIIKDLTFIQKQNENKERVNKIVSEWRAVGLVLDRFFFILYVIAIILSLILFFPKAGDEPYYDKEDQLNCDPKP